mmetsp:Transcript_67655/g.207248  ORF Transcript_67655/g.207248 Transcript_67655/m.207248 type:complete len:207 (+) Transcript_67655:812-1432(+)
MIVVPLDARGEQDGGAAVPRRDARNRPQQLPLRLLLGGGLEEGSRLPFLVHLPEVLHLPGAACFGHLHQPQGAVRHRAALQHARLCRGVVRGDEGVGEDPQRALARRSAADDEGDVRVCPEPPLLSSGRQHLEYRLGVLRGLRGRCQRGGGAALCRLRARLVDGQKIGQIDDHLRLLLCARGARSEQEIHHDCRALCVLWAGTKTA